MKKGVSTVIATILMLIITIALAGMAYMYISGVFTTKTQGIEIVDAYCIESGQTAATLVECLAPPCDQARLTVRNIGTSAITTSGVTVTQTAPIADTSTVDGTWAATPLDPGVTTTYTDVCGGTGGRTCQFRLIPPIGGTVTGTVYCT